MATSLLEASSPAPELPGGGRRARALLLFCVLLVAVCGLVYELVLVALGTYLFGNSVFQVSVVLAFFVSSMGLGSLLAKPLLPRALEAFVAVECLVALLGGTSALLLYASFAWLDLYQPAMLLLAAGVGVLVGCEIPLLLSLMQSVRPQAAGASVADLLAADYLGAVIAGLAFPLAILPLFGQIQGALAVGALNALAGLLVVALLGRGLSRRALLTLLAAPGGVLAMLAATAALSPRFEVSARQALYDDPVVLHERTAYQDLVLTSRAGDLRLFLNGDLQFSSRDEYRYHESLVHPALSGSRESVLILGGGDGLALREALRYPDARAITLVELDGRISELARREGRLRALNKGSLSDPRVRVVTADAFSWLRSQPDRFDAVIADFPDPDDAATAKLYSVEMYEMVRRTALKPGGRLVVQAGSPYFAAEAFWSVERSLRAAGLAARPYHVDVPSFGDWGFVLAREGRAPRLRVHPPGVLRFLDQATLNAAARFPRDRGRVAVEPSTLNAPVILDYHRRGWGGY